MKATPIRLQLSHTPALCCFHYFVHTSKNEPSVLVILDDRTQYSLTVTNAADYLGLFFTQDTNIEFPMPCIYEDTDGYFNQLVYREGGEFVRVVPLTRNSQPVTDIRTAIDIATSSYLVEHSTQLVRH
ncbi:hypothetical protein L1D14_04100 [Vibrio tubiashii]|uniref:hypothetical protein n=1 Tax=Vibrio tubiashii TaxID=29498 RepID=UPI001EFE63EF|nr:hypothetical protein [Vibrio tubiashii]MCG9575413.1 hypothetical protein [Vibrio tubiashii]